MGEISVHEGQRENQSWILIRQHCIQKNRHDSDIYPEITVCKRSLPYHPQMQVKPLP